MLSHQDLTEIISSGYMLGFSESTYWHNCIPDDDFTVQLRKEIHDIRNRTSYNWLQQAFITNPELYKALTEYVALVDKVIYMLCIDPTFFERAIRNIFRLGIVIVEYAPKGRGRRNRFIDSADSLIVRRVPNRYNYVPYRGPYGIGIKLVDNYIEWKPDYQTYPIDTM